MTDPDFLEVPPMLVIETDRLRLRTVRVEDAASIMPMITDKTTMKFTSGVVPNDLDTAKRWLSARCLGKDVLNFLVTLRDEELEETVVGIMGSYHWPEIGYLMHPAHAGKGYATEAVRAFLPAFFERVPSPSVSGGALGFDFVQAETDTENVASQKVLLKSGFQLVETLVDSFESPILGLRDTLVYRVARPGLTLESLGLVEPPVRLLDRQGKGGNGGQDLVDGDIGGKVEDEFVPPVQ